MPRPCLKNERKKKTSKPNKTTATKTTSQFLLAGVSRTYEGKDLM
jgi:hypothetical protein